MAFFNKYPYTDFHELNLDWILEEMKNLQINMDELLDKAIAEATAAAKAYVDERLIQIEADFAALQRNVNNLGLQFEQLDTTVNRFYANINAEIDALKRYINDSLSAQQMQMQLMISQNNEYLLREMESYLSQIKVINYFTGEKVTIQDMFNYLAGLHLNDAIDYATMATRAKTYTQFAAMNMNYTNLAMHGNSLYV